MPKGSAPGERRGGRQKGTPNKKTQLKQRAYKLIKASGKTPLEFFADILKDEKNPLDIRFQAAKELLPFMHPKLASIEARTGGLTHEDRLEEYRKMLEDDEPQVLKAVDGGGAREGLEDGGAEGAPSTTTPAPEIGLSASKSGLLEPTNVVDFPKSGLSDPIAVEDYDKRPRADRNDLPKQGVDDQD